MLQYEINEEVWLGRKTAIERSIVDRVLRNAPIEGVGLGSVAKEHNERQVAQHRKQQLRYSSQVVFDFRVSSNAPVSCRKTASDRNLVFALTNRNRWTTAPNRGRDEAVAVARRAVAGV